MLRLFLQSPTSWPGWCCGLTLARSPTLISATPSSQPLMTCDQPHRDQAGRQDKTSQASRTHFTAGLWLVRQYSWSVRATCNDPSRDPSPKTPSHLSDADGELKGLAPVTAAVKLLAVGQGACTSPEPQRATAESQFVGLKITTRAEKAREHRAVRH
jgi:hypothetical protein